VSSAPECDLTNDHDYSPSSDATATAATWGGLGQRAHALLEIEQRREFDDRHTVRRCQPEIL
jgi:hypothetical protein